MKKVFLFLVMTASVLLTHADQVVRAPRVSAEFAADLERVKIASENQDHPTQHFFTIEGVWSNPYSPIRWEDDYYVVKSSNPNGGRIFRVHLGSGGWSGIVNPIILTDAVTQEQFFVTLNTQDNRNGFNNSETTEDGYLQNYFHYGGLQIGNDVYNIVVAYYRGLSYPSISITWGAGSDLLYAGTILDVFDTPYVEEPATTTELAMGNSIGNEGLEDGLYLVVSSPREYGQLTVESTTNFRDWNEVAISPLYIIGDMIVYRIPPGNTGFYRAIER